MFTDNAPKPAGHYSQAIEHDGLLYVSGQLSINPHTGPIDSKSIRDQAQLVLQNLKAILEAEIITTYRSNEEGTIT
ncbi:MAG: hypothetical protein JRH15_00845 [Deltaproteobacteria bacterium]|nr:hypothetical protein [Deltaproteobacteria bacterium]